ncbi:protein PLASTID MOVEMENT IMPAIRED 1-like [Phalaenopsis equestris]|uniref:protein PLASTID MOVEMENT IMPAIRED 1-like n=1 Tax=Phalaenopsis equestris TaxID=78828 RepID=UPI0009E19C6D|nr:protein PLASTID MOVEMENT IMPAIRED 1-like [Phalaenopsis equestris]
MAPSLHPPPPPPPPMADTDNNKLLQELDALSQSLYQAHTTGRRTASLALPRASDAITTADHNKTTTIPSSDPRHRPRRSSMSPFRSRRQPEPTPSSIIPDPLTDTEKKGIWNWKPLRAISHIGKQRLSILFSVEVVGIQSLPASMNGLRLIISVRKKESKEGVVNTMPARAVQSTADFEETLFIKTHVYCSGGRNTGKPLRFEPRVFIISTIAIDAPELEFGGSSIDLSSLVKESIERSLEGSRIRQWDMTFKLSGKAKGGELVMRLGFQIMEDGGVGIYDQEAEVPTKSGFKGSDNSSSSIARRHSKSSFSISTTRKEILNPNHSLPLLLHSFPSTPSKLLWPLPFTSISSLVSPPHGSISSSSSSSSSSLVSPPMAPSLQPPPPPPMADTDNNKLLQELAPPSQSLYQAHTTGRRTASLALPRASDAITTADHNKTTTIPSSDPRHRPRRSSMSPFRSRRQPEPTPSSIIPDPLTDTEKKGIWNWKPLRAISHIGKQRLSILFSVEVVGIQSLPASMNGLRLIISVRKKESKEGVVNTMPARAVQSTADFEETLFIKTHVYCSGGRNTGKPLRFEPRVFIISTIAIDAPELEFGRSSIDLSSLVKESIERSLEGSRIRQWDMTFKLSGKAKGGELVMRLGFQIMEDGGVGIYDQEAEVPTKSGFKGSDNSSSSIARRHSKSSFSISSPRSMRRTPSAPPTKDGNSALELKGIEDFNLDEDTSPKSQLELEAKVEDLDLPDFDVIDKGIEVGDGGEEEAKVAKAASASSEVVKEVVHDNAHSLRLTELDLIANQIKALESMMSKEGGEAQGLDAEEERATREFLQMLELEGDEDTANYSLKVEDEEVHPKEEKSYLSDLGKGLGSVVQTRDGGYLTSMNPFNIKIQRREMPKLAMQISKPIIITDSNTSAGFEFFQRFSARGFQELESKLQSLTSMDELEGKTAEQIAFEGIAAAIVSGRKKGMANSTAAKSVADLKSMARAMNEGREERILSGIWNVREEPSKSVEEVLCFSLQKMEVMAVEGLKMEAGIEEEEAPFEVSPVRHGRWILDSAAEIEEWLQRVDGGAKDLILMVVVQLRDPVRRYEAVGAPMMAVVQAAGQGEGKGLKVGSMHLGGMKMGFGRRRSVWDGEKQRLTAMQW